MQMFLKKMGVEKFLVSYKAPQVEFQTTDHKTSWILVVDWCWLVVLELETPVKINMEQNHGG